MRAWLCDVANEIKVSAPVKFGLLRTSGHGLGTNTAGHSVLVVNICGTIMSSFAIG